MNFMKIKKGDQVKIMAGNDRGKTGKVLAAIPEEGKIVVEGLNIKKKHVRPRQQGKKGELVRIPAPFSASRAALVCPHCGRSVRIGFALKTSGQKQRICKKCQGEI